MQGRSTSPFRFLLEQWIQKGVLSQLLIMASLVVLVAILGGAVAWGATTNFETPQQAMWWAFLRLTDPGYLGDDEGVRLRTISTTITVLGYVIFMGSLIAIMTQWLSRTIRQLESGVTPIAMRDHIVILGWTNRTPEVVLRLLDARGSLQRFLSDSTTKHSLRVVVLSEDSGAERRLELEEHLGEHWNEGKVFLRSGSSLHVEHLERLDLLRASVVLVPGADFELGGSEMTDARVVKTLMTLDRLLTGRPDEQRPHLVAEIFDPRKVSLARNTVEYKIEVVASNRIIGRLIFQSVRHRGLAQVLIGIFSQRQGNSLYLRSVPELAGLSPAELAATCAQAVVLGFLRREGSSTRIVMDPCGHETPAPDDLIIFLAKRYDDCRPTHPERRMQPAIGSPIPPVTSSSRHCILVLGWSHKIGALISELNESQAEQFDVAIMSRMSIEERETWLSRIAVDEERVRIRNLHGDHSIEADLTAANPESFDHVLLLASDWMDSSEAADARTILGYALLRSLMKTMDAPPEVLVELLDPRNSHLFEDGRDVVLVTPRVLSHLLANVSLRPELNSVYDTLFGVGGSEIDLRRAAGLDLVGKSVSFENIQEAAFARGLAALGVLCLSGPDKGVHLNPERNREWKLGAEDHVVVLASDSY